MESLSFSDPRRVPALPLRPSWLAAEAINRAANISESIRGVMDTWNAWADCAEKVFQQMGDQIEELEVADDEYISFIRMFASHAARPTQRPLENTTEHEAWFTRTMPHRYLTHLDGLWTAYADKLEETHVSMTVELGRCNLLTSRSETTSMRGHLHGILRSMLGPERLFQGITDTRAQQVVATAEMNYQGPSVTHTDQLVSGIEHMSLHHAPATSMGGAQGLVIRLKNMSMEPGITRLE